MNPGGNIKYLQERWAEDNGMVYIRIGSDFAQGRIAECWLKVACLLHFAEERKPAGLVYMAPNVIPGRKETRVWSLPERMRGLSGERGRPFMWISGEGGTAEKHPFNAELFILDFGGDRQAHRDKNRGKKLHRHENNKRHLPPPVG